MKRRKPLTHKPSTPLEVAAAKQAHKEIRQAGFQPTEDNTFVMDDRVWARSLESIPGTGGHPMESRVLPVKKPGNPHPTNSSSRGYRVCARTTSGGWSNYYGPHFKKGAYTAADLTAAEADRLMAKLKREGFEVAKFKGRKRVK